MEGQKQCNTCKAVKPLEEFHLDKSNKSGMRFQCKACRADYSKAHYGANKEQERAKRKVYREANKAQTAARNKVYYEANRERITVAMKAYYIANKERHAAKGKAWYKANKEQSAAAQKAWNEANKEQVLAGKKIYYEANKEQILARKKIYQIANREKLRAYRKVFRNTPHGRAFQKVKSQKRRARGQFAFDTLITKSDLLHWEKDGAVCYLTGEFLPPGKVIWDHVVPLVYGGTSDVWNFLPTSISANCSKNNRIVYFDIVTREARYTLDPCPGGPTWPRIPLTQPSLDHMQEMVAAWKIRHQKEDRDAA